MILKPIGDRVLVARDTAEESRGGIVLPDSSKSKPTTGTVEAIGDTVEFTKVNDRVMLPQYGGVEVTINKKVFVLLAEKEILGIFQ